MGVSLRELALQLEISYHAGFVFILLTRKASLTVFCSNPVYMLDRLNTYNELNPMIIERIVP